MDIVSAIRYMRSGQSAKVNSMRGYIKRVDNELAEGQKENYTLTFVKSNSDEDSPSFTFIVTTDGITSVETAGGELKLDPVLFQHILLGDWVVGNTEDFEIARKGSNSQW